MFRVRGSILNVVERMDEEYIKMLQSCDAHSTEYVDRCVRHVPHILVYKSFVIAVCCRRDACASDIHVMCDIRESTISQCRKSQRLVILTSLVCLCHVIGCATSRCCVRSSRTCSTTSSGWKCRTRTAVASTSSASSTSTTRSVSATDACAPRRSPAHHLASDGAANIVILLIRVHFAYM